MFGRSSSPSETHMKAGSQTTFVEDVVKASKSKPILVYFTANWCGPCKTLGPALEKAVNAAKGKITGYKFDIDSNRELAAQMRIQSIPAIFAFHDGNPIDGFMGAKSPSEITKFIQDIIAKTGGNDTGNPVEEAIELMEQGAIIEAIQLFTTHLRNNPEDAAAFAGMIRCHLLLDDLASAEAMFNSAPESIQSASEMLSVKASIDLKNQAKSTGPISELRQKINANPNDHQTRYDLAVALYAQSEASSAVDELLEVFRRDREWSDGAAKSQLLRIFESLKPDDPVVMQGRRRLSSLIFA